MIKFINKAIGLKENQSYMYSDKVEPSPLIKIPTSDATKEKFGSISDEKFFKDFCDPETCILKN